MLNNTQHSARSEVLEAEVIKIEVLWNMTPVCSYNQVVYFIYKNRERNKCIWFV